MKLKKLGLAAMTALAVFGLASCGNTTNDVPSIPDTPSNPSNPGGNENQPNPVNPEVIETEDLTLSGNYTYNTYAESLGTNWNPHTWENSSDSSILSYLEVGFVDMSIKSTEDQEYQWVYEMATSITDVTKENQNDLVKYHSSLPTGKKAEDVEEGYVYQIKLNKDAKWQNGVAINADSYVESMKRLLNPEMLNYRANLYISGESAIAGAYGYYYSKTQGLYVSIGKKYANNKAAVDANETIYIDVSAFWGASGYTSKDGTKTVEQWLDKNDETVYGRYEFCDEFTPYNMYTDPNFGKYFPMLEKYTDSESEDYLGEDATDEQVEAACNASYAALSDDEKAQVESTYYDEFSAADLWAAYFNPTTGAYKSYVEVGGQYESWLSIYQNNDEYDPSMGYDVVGLYKVDDYTINYVLQNPEDVNYFFTSMTSMWLVYTPLYDQLTKTVGNLKTTTYGSSLESTMSYGPYKMSYFQKDKRMIFDRNENWYGYQTTEDGYVYSVTQFDVDGMYRQQYQTQKIVVDVLTKQTAKQNFLSGTLDDWAPDAQDIPEYTRSPQMYKVDETYTMRLFFNLDEEKLAALDENGLNQNGKVLTNYNFRKALSFAIDRTDWVTTTQGYKPATYLMNNLYYYNIFEDPTSSYRRSEQAMQAIVDFYGYEYGTGKPYADLEEAYYAITGYNLTLAKSLMKTACEELVAAGKYVAGQPIKFTIAYSKDPMDATLNSQVQRLQDFFNAAAEGSGFGTITLQGLGSIEDRHGKVANGEYAIGYGGWGGAAFYPFRNFQVYMDPAQYDINEAGCWDPETEKLTLNINGDDVTMTYQAWSNCMIGNGDYADADFDTKLEITSKLEVNFMSKYYCVPLCCTTSVSLLSYKVSYFTEEYNIMYGFGGLRLMKYNYTDEAWTEYVDSLGGTLSYK